VDATYVFAGLVVSDRDRAADWYARFFGRSPDMLPNDAEAAWQLAGSASLYLLADPARAGQGVFTLIVGDLDAELAAIEARGIAATAIDDLPAGRKCVFTDPDGNSVGLAQLSPG
jgi:predicted enzyme related to lactoylglutathione lyase